MPGPAFDPDSRPVREDNFGSRYLKDENAIYDYNAWDDVEWPEEMEEIARQKIEKQKETAVSEERAAELLADPSQQWNAFYGNHSNKFFMDRKWLSREAPELFESKELVLYDIGCGVGNATFPLLETNPNLFIYCSDYSGTAIQNIKENPLYSQDKHRCNPSVWDITQPNPSVPEAIPPEHHRSAMENIVKMLKPGGIILVKDYGRHDLTQLRFKTGRYIKDNFYCRGDNTLVYYFSAEELHDLLIGAGLKKIENFVDKRLLVNRKEQKKMYRRWIQCKYQKGKLMKLCCETMKYRVYLEKFLANDKVATILRSDGIKGNRDLAMVIIYEMLFGKGVKFFGKQFKLAARLVSNAIELHKLRLERDGITPASCAEKSISESIPRYVRVNTIEISMENVLKELSNEGYKTEQLEPTTSAEEFRAKCKNIGLKQVFVDPHVDNLLIFNNKTDFHNHQLVSKGVLFLQDKASCFSAFVLNPKPGSYAFDACAAPGNKTSHMAAIMENTGVIFACDMNQKRLETLQETMRRANTDIVKIFHADFLHVDSSDPKYARVKYMIVDPPCSGSGIAKRGDFMSEEKKKVDNNRLEKLHNLQVMLLKHAFSFPGVIRVVYSTCSVHVQENEKVVSEIIETPEIKSKFKLVDPLPTWTHRGQEQFDFADKVIRADPETDLTNGFFVALFERKLKLKKKTKA